MGLCCSDCYSYSHNNLKYEAQPVYATCYKCYDKFKLDCGGCYSNRRSCRMHNFDNNDYCIDCHEHRDKLKRYTCYHVKKFSYFS